MWVISRVSVRQLNLCFIGQELTHVVVCYGAALKRSRLWTRFLSLLARAHNLLANAETSWDG